jgi:hypothetical protein
MDPVFWLSGRDQDELPPQDLDVAAEISAKTETPDPFVIKVFTMGVVIDVSVVFLD